MKKIFLIALTICALLITSTALANNRIVSTMYVVECNQSITLRDAPSVYANELAQIPLGQAVGFIENAGNGFYKINYDGLIGYALAEYLSADRSGVAGISGVVVNCRISITLRDAPSVNAAELMQIPLGERVSVYPYYETDEFYCVQYRGVRGYVLKTYLRVE
ncbi:MAG: SH3 domain-containing protein [Selenomonadaceae bacterium]|nr:SH3 domain-containing protein [Selenomonadaceae bacterium]